MSERHGKAKPYWPTSTPVHRINGYDYVPHPYGRHHMDDVDRLTAESAKGHRPDQRATRSGVELEEQADRIRRSQFGDGGDGDDGGREVRYLFTHEPTAPES